jgi:hypothetical protein
MPRLAHLPPSIYKSTKDASLSVWMIVKLSSPMPRRTSFLCVVSGISASRYTDSYGISLVEEAPLIRLASTTTSTVYNICVVVRFSRLNGRTKFMRKVRCHPSTLRFKAFCEARRRASSPVSLPELRSVTRGLLTSPGPLTPCRPAMDPVRL